jgi:hypothetical protein
MDACYEFFDLAVITLAEFDNMTGRRSLIRRCGRPKHFQQRTSWVEETGSSTPDPATSSIVGFCVHRSAKSQLPGDAGSAAQRQHGLKRLVRPDLTVELT